MPPEPLLEANEKHKRPPPALFDEDGLGDMTVTLEVGA